MPDISAMYCFPISKDSKADPGKVWPGDWFDSNPYRSEYLLNGQRTFHTGADLQRPQNQDKDEPVFAIGDGIVLAAQLVPESPWGNLIVILHTPDPISKTPIYSRYAHLREIDPAVNIGALVKRGQQIGRVGMTGGVSKDGTLRFDEHLHFDIGITDLLRAEPTFLPDDIGDVTTQFADPAAFFRERIPAAQPPSTPPSTPPEVKAPEAETIKLLPRYAKEKVNFRSAPRRASDTLAGELAPNERVELVPDFFVDVDRVRWVLVKARGKLVFVASEFLLEQPLGSVPTTPTPPTPPTQPGVIVHNQIQVPNPSIKVEVPIAPGVKKIGLHMAGGPVNEGFLPMLERLAKAGRPLAGVMVVNQPVFVKAIKQVSPKTFVVARPFLFVDWDNPATRGWNIDGQAWFNQFKDVLNAYQGADACQLLNEWLLVPDTPFEDIQRFGDFYRQLMVAANNGGWKVTIGDVSPSNLDDRYYHLLKPMFADAQMAGNYFNYHGYSSQNDTYNMRHEENIYSMRFAKWAADFPALKFILGESGSFKAPRYRDQATTVNMMRQHQEQLAPLGNQVVSSMWWTIASTPDWAQDDCSAALPEIEAFLMDRGAPSV